MKYIGEVKQHMLKKKICKKPANLCRRKFILLGSNHLRGKAPIDGSENFSNFFNCKEIICNYLN